MQNKKLNTTEDMPEITAQYSSVTQQNTSRKQKVVAAFKNYFTATRLAYLGIFSALSFALYFLEIPLMAWSPLSFLKLDFSNVFVLVSGFALGPVSAIIVCIVKELLHALVLTQTVGVGELANVLLTLPYVLVPTVIYKNRKGIKSVLISLILGSLAQVIVSVPVNWLLNFPFYLNLYSGTPWIDGMAFYAQYWYFAVLFNVIKTVIISAVTLLIYKPLSRLIKRTNAKFEENKMKKHSNAE